MGFSNKKRAEIKKFILKEISEGSSPYKETLEKFNVSRQTISKYLSQLEQENIIGKEENHYTLLNIVDEEFHFNNLSELDEEELYEQYIYPFIKDNTENIVQIIHYAFTEMVNNAIDHSGSETLTIMYFEDILDINIIIFDRGIGIFKKIMKDHKLLNEDEAIFELRKGKLTSDEERHSGEGIFFTSKAVDVFNIISYNKRFEVVNTGKNIRNRLEELEENEVINGTGLCFTIAKDSTTDVTEVFEKYTDENMDFSRTEIKIKLAEQYSNSLISRSQAKRVLNRIEKFKEVLLDFEDVKIIGQGFADEVFRIFLKNHPSVKVKCINCIPKVEFMIKRGRAKAEKEIEEQLFFQ